MIVDVHTHVGEIVGFNCPDCGAEPMLALMESLGIDLAVQMPTAGLTSCLEEAYASGEAVYDQSAGRILYGLTYDPHYIEDSLRWLGAALGRPGSVCCKIHPSFHQVWPNDPRYDPVWQFAASHDLPIISHSWTASTYNPVQKYATPDGFADRVERFAAVNLVLAHAGGRYEGHLAATELAKRWPNVYVDLSGDCYSFGFIEWLVGQIGASRILFGSDANWIDPRTHLGRIYDADITLAEKELILGGNASRLFKLSV
jgi:predicted TIM-barrel fold metal-dependent hydrolase